MKEKTRKTVAIWLFGIGIVTGYFWNIIAAPVWLILRSDGYDWPVLMIWSNLLRYFVTGLFLLNGVLIIKKLLNRVTHRFFVCLLAGWVGLPLVTSLISYFSLSIVSDYRSANDLVAFSETIITLLSFVILLSGTALLQRYYTLDSFLAAKLRLFQTGIILTHSSVFLFLIYRITGESMGIWIEYGDLLNGIGMKMVNLVGHICWFVSLIGIIKSDLLNEHRKEEVFGKLISGLSSRAVVGGVCFGVTMIILYFVPLFFHVVLVN